jgi:ribokinase
MSNIEVIGLGALNIDLIYRVERVLEDGEKAVDAAGSFPGGSAANTIYGLARLGIVTGFVGAVGDDSEGRLLTSDFKKAGVDTSQIATKPKTRSGQTLCLSDKSGRRSLYVMPGANSLLTIEDIDLAYLNQAKLVHLSSFVDDRQFKLSVELMGGLDPSVKVSFSPGELYAASGLKALAPIFSRTSILFTNEHEMQELTGSDFATGAKDCLEYGCRIIAITLGKGKTLAKTETATSYIRDTSKEYLIEPPGKTPALAIDTTGAGDAFAAGFLFGFLNGKGLEECGRLGDIVARCSIAGIGARPGLPTLNELSRRYHRLYKQPL